MDRDFPEITLHTYIAEYKNKTDLPLRKILVGNLDERMTRTVLGNFFSAYGCVEECSIHTDILHIPTAHITFRNEKDAIRVVTENNIILHNNYLRVGFAAYNQQPESLEQLLSTSDRLDKIQNSPRNSYNRDDLWSDNDKPSLNKLNDDCLKHIFSFLSIVNKLCVEIVCKRWKGLSLESWSTMRTLDFSPSTWGMSRRDIISISTDAFRGVLSRCGKFLREISCRRDLEYGIVNLASYSIPFTRDTLSVIGDYCPNIKKFDTTALMMMARSIKALRHTCANLTTVVSRAREDIKYIESSLQKLCERAVKLEHFQISESDFTGECLLRLSEKTMHTFIIEGCTVHDKYLSQVLKRLINLRDLRIINCNNVNDLTMSVINNHCTNLRILKLKYLYHVSMTEFKNTNLTNLEALSIRYNNNLTNDILLHIVQRCSKITKINVKDCPVTIEGIRNVRKHYCIPIKFRYFDISTFDDL